MQRDYDGKQPGNPSSAAQAILKIAEMKNPPLRLLGTDAVDIVEQADMQRLKEITSWRDLSASRF